MSDGAVFVLHEGDGCAAVVTVAHGLEVGPQLVFEFLAWPAEAARDEGGESSAYTYTVHLRG